ncbi:MAG: type II toxin-antitoxin system HicB family antitoxin [Bacteriovoracaceae bacterium]|nr:type II toxin-antitoxin system HicB family antitoxin [Bacteriovoracaceae bacterium]
MKYHFKIHKEKSGYWAECVELEGCQTEADSLIELYSNMEEVLNVYLSEPESSKIIFPLPQKKQSNSEDFVAVSVDPSVAFSFLLRRYRLQKKITLKEMAEKLKMKNLNTYVKLEKASSSNPELRTLAKIKSILSDFPINMIF